MQDGSESCDSVVSRKKVYSYYALIYFQYVVNVPEKQSSNDASPVRSEVNVDTKQDSAPESDDEMQSESEGDSDEEESEEEEEGMSQFSNEAIKTKDVLYTGRGAEMFLFLGP